MTATAGTAVTVRLTGAEREGAIQQAAQLRRAGERWSDVLDAVGVDRGAKRFMQDTREYMRKHDMGGKRPKPRSSATRELVESVRADGTRAQAGGERAQGLQPDDGTDSKRERLREYLRTTWEARRVPMPPPAEKRVICAVGDLHGSPDPAVLAAMIEAKADIYIVGGDLTDSAQASRHPDETKAEWLRRRRSAMKDEMQNVRAWLETLLDHTTGDVRVFLGNHDQWSWKQAQSLLPDFLLEQFPEPIDVLLYGLGERVKRVGHPVIFFHRGGAAQNIDHENEFIYVVGDVLFSHLNKANSQAETGVSKVYRQWFVHWDKVLGFENVSVIVHFHVHSRSMQSARGGHMLLVEPGMGGGAETEMYKHSYQGKWRPGVQGCVVMTQYWENPDWRTDLGSVQLIAPRVRRGG